VLLSVASDTAPYTTDGKAPADEVPIQTRAAADVFCAEAVSDDKLEVAVFPRLVLGAEVTLTANTTVSVAAVAAAKLTVTGTVTVSPVLADGTVPTTIDEMVLPVPAAAFAGAVAESNPNPNADTATSAMRLRVVFVDICFLSIVDPGAFPRSAWHKKDLSYDMSASFCAS